MVRQCVGQIDREREKERKRVCEGIGGIRAFIFAGSFTHSREEQLLSFCRKSQFLI